MKRTKKAKPFQITDIFDDPIIQSPEIGTIVEHSGWAPGDRLEGYPADVFIVSGQYYSNERLSNFWTWRKVKKDKFDHITLGPNVHGYGAFRESKNKYDLNLIVKLTKRK